MNNIRINRMYTMLQNKHNSKHVHIIETIVKYVQFK